MSKHKFLFLDIDGVLNNQNTFTERKTYIRENFTKEELANLKRLDVAPHELDRMAIRLLDEVIDVTGASIVISSTWRILLSLEELREVFRVVGFRNVDAIVDVTPRFKWRSSFRGNEIHDWIEQYKQDHNMYVTREKVTYAIVDDDSDMLLWQKDQFVQTSFKTGLLEEHADKLIRILGVAK